jgi:hypothetical protein
VSATIQKLRWTLLLAATLGSASPSVARAQLDGGPHPADDDIIIIEEDSPPAAPTGPPHPSMPDLSGITTRVPGLSNLEFPSPPVLPLGEFTLSMSPADVNEAPARGGRTLFGLRADQVLLGGHLGFRPSLRPLGNRLDDLARTFTDAQAEIDVRPDVPVSFHLDVFARVRGAAGLQLPTLAQLEPLDFFFPRKAQPGARWSGVVEVGEAYASVKLDRVRITVGRQLFSWTQSLSSPLASLLNPLDPRDGLSFPDELQARTATLAAQVQGTLGPVGIQALVIPFFSPPRAPLFAEDAEAFDPSEPVLSLVSARNTLGSPAVASGLQQNVTPADRLQLGELGPTLAGRAFFSLNQADVALSLVLGHDPTPQLTMAPQVARGLALAADRSRGAGEPLAALCGNTACDGLNNRLRMRWRQTVTAQVEANGTLGPAIVRGTAHVSPGIGSVGRTAQVINRDGLLESVDVYTAGTSLALESGYTELVQGVVEAGYDVMGNIPAGARVARYEANDQARNWERTVHRPTLSARLQGMVLDDITWRVRATLAPWQRELFLSPRVGYRLSLNQEVVMGTELFLGWPGTRAYFLMPMSRAYIEWGYRF